ncbi:glucan 1,3-beta-glucosidase [Phyllosticta citrichinensis]|uniref:Glucan 1,3-beta-glucosidase n=1 Tax=Phyllosticta citrichinensis TaxID=1130410 RepID=A0ABR1XN62_9PEZI
MKLTQALAVASLLQASSALAIPHKKRAYELGRSPVRGANIGGWLVLEPWITPSVFDQFDTSLGIVDEYTLCQNSDNAANVLKSHWDSWVSQDDFQKLADNGFSAVRIPIGYWAFQKYGEDPYIQGAAPYLDTAIEWARNTGLAVWIDLHGAPRSQNGFDNSGQKTSSPGWTTHDSVSATEEVISIIANKYATANYSDVVKGIQLLNEPLMSNLEGGFDVTKAYYENGFSTVRGVDGSEAMVVIQDGFANPSQWNGVLSGEGVEGAVVDHHEYQVFTDSLVAMSADEHDSYVCTNAQNWGEGFDKFVVVGEWTGAMTDCATYLNGFGIGARYDGTYSGSSYVGSCEDKNDISKWSDEMKTATTNYINAQLDVWEYKTQGWFWWNFKTEGAAEWDLFKLIDAGVFPTLEGRAIGSACG